MALMGKGRPRRRHWPLGQQEATARWKCPPLLQLSALFNVNSVKDCESVWWGTGSAFPAFNLGNLVTVYIAYYIFSSFLYTKRAWVEGHLPTYAEGFAANNRRVNLKHSRLLCDPSTLYLSPVACFCPHGLHRSVEWAPDSCALEWSWSWGSFWERRYCVSFEVVGWIGSLRFSLPLCSDIFHLSHESK